MQVGYAAGDALIAEYRVPPPPPPFTNGTNPGEWRPTPPGNVPFLFLFLAATKPFTFDDPSAVPGAAAAEAPQLGVSARLQRGQAASVPSRATRPSAPAPLRQGPMWRGSGRETSSRNGTKPSGSSPWISSSRSARAARLLALANLAAADAAITVWESKYHFNFWRPITAIREGDLDGNNLTKGDPAWTPFIQSAHFPAGSQTPPYPDYTSGANGLTGAFVTTLQLFFRTDRLNFEIYKATPAAVAICTNPRLYQRLSDAAEEVVDARIWLGIHFRFADEAARRQGTRVAQWVFERFLRPVREDHHDRDDKDHDR